MENPLDADLSRHCCCNPDCDFYGQRGQGNLSVCDHYGSKNTRLLYCRSCRARFSENKGSVLFQSRLPITTVISILEHLIEGCGIRKTARLVKVHRTTVARYAQLSGEHAKTLHDELVAFPPNTREVQLDEKWSFVGKKQANCDPNCSEDQNKGEYWAVSVHSPIKI